MKQSFFSMKQAAIGYEKQVLISDIEIALAKGEILTLIGPNGEGKSTLLKSIAGQLPLLFGEMTLGGQSLTQMKREERAKKVAVLFTESLQTELMSCKEVVATGRYPYTGRFGILSKKDWQVVEEAMELVQVQELAEQDFKKLSDGQRQRVLLSRAMAGEPELLLMDEPTSFLDIHYKLEFLRLLKELAAKKQLTVILSMHEVELAGSISSQILCLKEHRVNKVGTPEEILTEPYLSELFELSEELKQVWNRPLF